MSREERRVTAKKRAVAAVVERDGKYLLGRRSPHKASAPGYWCPITGGIGEGESEEAAIERELFEETGLRGAARERLDSFDTRDGATMIHWWRVECPDGAPYLANDEHTELGWFTALEMRNLEPFFVEDLQLFERLAEDHSPNTNAPENA